MVFDTLIHLLLKIPREIFDKIPNVQIGDVPLPYNFMEWLENMLMYSKYFFPMELLCYIISTSLQLRMLRVQIATFRFIKSNIPGMGNWYGKTFIFS